MEPNSQTQTESENISSEEIAFWLRKGEEWKSPDKKTDLSSHVKDLLEFLNRLNNWLKSLGSVSTSIQQQPKIGHLLGRLCSLQHLLSHEPKIYSTLLGCVQVFHTENPQDGMARKAKNWAESQIRHTVSFYNQSNPGKDVAESVGYTSADYNQVATDQLIESIERDLEYLVEQQHQYLSSFQSPSINLKDVSELCIPLLSSSSSKGIAECLLRLHARSPDDKISDLFLEKVTETQDSAYNFESKDFSLKFKSLISLWLRYLPALEQEILLLLKSYVIHLRHLGHNEALNVITSRQLPRACAEHPVLYKAVDLCIQQVLWETKDCQHVLRFMHLFQVAVNEAIHLNPCAEVTVDVLFPQRVRSLVNLLAVDPSVLPKEAHALHLPSIHSSLASTLTDPVIANNPAEVFTVWTTFVKFQQWYHAAVAALVRKGCKEGTQDDLINACLDIVAWFSCPLSDALDCDIKDVIQDVANTFHKWIVVTFSKTELRSRLPRYLSSSNTKRKQQLVTIVQELLMSAIFQSSCMNPADVVEVLDLLQTFTGACTSTYTKLTILLDYSDTLRISLPAKLTKFGFEDSSNPSHILQTIEKLKSSISSDIKANEESLLSKRCAGLTQKH